MILIMNFKTKNQNYQYEQFIVGDLQQKLCVYQYTVKEASRLLYYKIVTHFCLKFLCLSSCGQLRLGGKNIRSWC